MPDPGQVYYLPPELREGLNKGDRPHLVMSLCPAGVDTATFAYGSTRATDAIRGAEHVLVDPFAGVYRGTGLSRPTYFYPSRLLTFAVDDLPLPAGRIIDEFPALKQSLRRALGLGRGVTREANFRGANRRGRIAEYGSQIAADIGTSLCLVVTEPRYSRTALQQTTIPILDPAWYDAAPSDVLVEDTRRWRARPFRHARPVLFAVSLVTTVHEHDSIARYSGTVVSPDTMREVDAALALQFGI